MTTRHLLGASFASALLGGALGVALTTTWLRPEQTEAPQPAPGPHAVKATPQELVRLQARVAEIEGRLETLGHRQRSRAALERYAESLARAEGGAPAATVAREPERPGVVDAEDPAFELAVRSVLDQVAWEKDEERAALRAKRQSDRAERQVALLTERLVLDEAQSRALAAALAKQMESFRSLREGGDGQGGAPPLSREERRQRVDAIRSETERELGEVLDENQLKEYRAFVEEEGIGPRGSGRSNRESRTPR